MNFFKKLTNVDMSSTTIEDAVLKSKLLSDSQTVEPGQSGKTFSINPLIGKVVITRSDNDDVVIEDIANYPLGRSHREIVKEYELEWNSSSSLASFADAINVAAAKADKILSDTGMVYVITVRDKVNLTSTKTVIPSVFSGSTYVANVEHVIVGDAAAGNLLDTTIASTNFNSDGIVI